MVRTVVNIHFTILPLVAGRAGADVAIDTIIAGCSIFTRVGSTLVDVCLAVTA